MRDASPHKRFARRRAFRVKIPIAVTPALSHCEGVPNSTTASSTRPQVRWELVVVGLLWVQLFAALTPVWKDGIYYDYGWFVPPIAAYFLWRRWQFVTPVSIDPTARTGLPAASGMASAAGNSIRRAQRSSWPVILACAAVLAAILWLCRVTFADSPGWRLPVWGHAAVVVVAHHGLLASTTGWKTSLSFAPVTLFALSTVPYPMRIEGPLVHQLADVVVAVTREVLLFLGLPVSVAGERLFLDGQQVAVTDDCSGLRSWQSLIMAGMFFGELLWLSWPRRIALLFLAAGAAVVTNMGRAGWLAWTSFQRGPDAMADGHDVAGHFAFAAGCLLLFLSALALRPRARTIVIRRPALNPSIHPSEMR
ncbi:MAG: exosortase/archaeosortase family protein [Verrucomicrobiales bacterium]